MIWRLCCMPGDAGIKEPQKVCSSIAYPHRRVKLFLNTWGKVVLINISYFWYLYNIVNNHSIVL